jgi:hypothetical protein
MPVNTWTSAAVFTAMTTRRDFLTALSGLPLAALASPALAQQGQQNMPLRRFSASERVPVIGLGSSKGVEEIAKNGDDSMRRVLRTLVAHAIRPTTRDSGRSSTRRSSGTNCS